MQKFAFTRIGGNSSVGRALASQAEGRGFEPRFPLKIIIFNFTTMTKSTFKAGENYSSPQLSIIRISIEKGFAASSIDFNGGINDYDNKDVDPSSYEF